MDSTAPRRNENLYAFLALILVVLVGAYFRFTGLFWGQYEYQHPDERFLVWVAADIAPVHSPEMYFDTANSTLNPANRGHAFYVYGDFPVIVTRYATGLIFAQVGWREVLQTGRGLSALCDLLTVLLVYLTAEKLFRWRVGLLAGLFSAGAVLQIQQAHFFTTDSFATLFTMLAVFLSVWVAKSRRPLRWALGFGAAVGLAMASKINTFPVAGLLPAALALNWLANRGQKPLNRLAALGGIALASGLVAFVVFRLAQPYAFSGPGILDVTPDPGWISSLQEQRAQASGDVDFPPALQWARRSKLFSFQNLTLWGLGLPLGLLAWGGSGWLALRLLDRLLRRRAGDLLTGAWPGAILILGWTGAYFAWQSTAWNPTMRYQLPIYPTLAILAAAGLGDLIQRVPARVTRPGLWRGALAAAGGLVLALTLAWAFAYTRIYTRTETRVATSQWILEHVPAPLNLSGEIAGEMENGAVEEAPQPWQQLVSLQSQAVLRPGQPYWTAFDNPEAGALAGLTLTNLRVASISGGGGGERQVELQARLLDPAQPGQPLAEARAALPLTGELESLDLGFAGLPRLEAGRRYVLALDLLTPEGSGNEAGGAVVNLSGGLKLNLYGRVSTVAFQYDALKLTDVTFRAGGTLTQVRLPEGAAASTVTVMLMNTQTREQHTAYAAPAGAETNPMPGADRPLVVDPPLKLRPGVRYQLALLPGNGPLEPGQTLWLDLLDDPRTLSLAGPAHLGRPEDPLWATLTARGPVRPDTGQPVKPGRQAFTLRQVTLPHLEQADPAVSGPTRVALALFSGDNAGDLVAQAEITADLNAPGDPRGGQQSFRFDPPVTLEEGRFYTLRLTPERGALAARGSAVANESTWDMGLPFRMGGYDPFGGIYRGDLNFEMYWDDNAEKLQRFINILDQADYIFFSSNRQWGTTTRVPERYPLTSAFYRALLGCPPERDLLGCYNTAESDPRVGPVFEGKLGYDLAQVFTSYPNLGPLRINDQFAEEAFTVYDHPKVFVFKKRADYDPAAARSILGAVDFSKVVHLTPRKASGFKDGLLPANLWAIQQAGGTWASLFPPEGWQNRYPWVGALLWYLLLGALGLLAYPLVRLALPGLPDRGYPLARAAGLVLLGYICWLAGSAGAPVTRGTVGLVFAGLGLLGLAAGWLQREGLRREWREKRGYFFAVEGVALALFCVQLLIRLGNPDLWHPIFGGEKPMDFSYFNAVLKSTVFPPYDPWFAGGTMNYYYYGYVLVGMPLKLAGINPAVGYNLILPMLFSLVGLAAYSIGWNLYAAARADKGLTRPGGARIYPAEGAAEGSLPAAPWPIFDETGGEYDLPGLPEAAPITTRRRAAAPFWFGLAAAAALLLLGNLGSARMYWQGWQKVMVSEEVMRQGSLFEHVTWASQGFAKWVTRQEEVLPYYPGDWYWKPSRAIQPEAGNEITEFPFFTFLYADLHAHLIALPVTLLVIAWGLGMVLGARGGRRSSGGREEDGGPPEPERKWLSLGLALLLGALAAGALRPANTWDQYTYLTFAAVALFYGQYRQGGRWAWARAGGLALLLAALALLLYRPFDIWFAQGYNSIELWKYARTGLSSYLVHWGLFLFVIAAWLIDETLDWLASTPVSALRRLAGYRTTLLILIAAAGFGWLALLARGIHIALLVVPLGVWALALLLRPGLPDAKRFVLFMTGTGLLLTLAVELVAVKGDIGRMNTVFKFYYQAWSLLSLSAAAALGFLWSRLPGWNRGMRRAWLVGLVLLVTGAALYPLTATRARIADRMEPRAPRVLDGMAYMESATYTDGVPNGPAFEMDLGQDYRAIRWAQRNIPGSPVIVEANTPEYRHWGTRFTIYTGLPGVVGWNWHQRQQRALTPDYWVTDRIADIQDFYMTTDSAQALSFLRRYNVQYIVLGQIERIWYAGPGLAKFPEQEGRLWEKVYSEGQTEIYKVK